MLAEGKIWVDELITDAMFDRSIAHPQEFDVVATTNLNGDYLADALASLVGGIGISPGANINYVTGDAIFRSHPWYCSYAGWSGQSQPILAHPFWRPDAATPGLDRSC